MTAEEIRQSKTMEEVLGMYGLHSKRGMISCPFHKDKTPSMKIYKQDFHCFSCGEHGDIFDFVQKMENVSFKEAFFILGGTYGKPDFKSKLAIYKAEKAKITRQKAQERILKRKTLNNMLIDIYRRYVACSEPYSDVWCDCMNALQIELYKHSDLNGLEARW